MFGFLKPKRTVDSVAAELLGGLADGTIRLADTSNEKAQDLDLLMGGLADKLRAYRKTQWQLLLLTILGLLSSLASLTASVSMLLVHGFKGQHTDSMSLAVVGLLVGVMTAPIVFRLVRVHDRATETKTVVRLARATDRESAIRVVKRYSEQLDEAGALAHR